MLDYDLNILIVDDDEVDRLALRRTMDRADIKYSSDEFSYGKKAISHLDNNRYDLIILDYLLPDIDGVKFLKIMRSKDIKTPVIVVTSQGDERIAVELMKAGAIDYIVKDQINNNNIKKVMHNARQIIKAERMREEVEHALKLSESRLTEAQRIAKIGSWEYVFDNDVVYWSEEMYQIFELDPETFKPTSEHFVTLFHPDDQPLIREGIDRAMSGEVINIDLRALMPDGSSKYVNFNAYFQHDDEGGFENFVGTVQDINQRKKDESELIEAKKLAEESGRIKEQFLANMSHEIRTPMNSIIGFTNLLLKDKKELDEKKVKFIKSIQMAGENLLVIINDILDFSKIESGKLTFEEVDFAFVDLISDVVNLFKQKTLEKKVKLSYKIDKKIPAYLVGDSVRLNQVLVNLISNSVKFTHKGSISLIVDCLKETDDKYYLKFAVKDTGIGIAQEKLENIFDSFTQASSDTTRKYGGTGLGLTIASKIIEYQGGKIYVESARGKGTTFYVEMPFGKSDRTVNSVDKESKEKLLEFDYPKNVKVLMAEDNEMNQELARFIFEDIEWDLDIAPNGLVALEKLKKGKYDVVLMDIQMPELDGHKTTEIIRNEFESPLCNIPILAITAHAMNSEMEKCLNVGMNGYLSKPFKVFDLVSKVTALILEKDDSEFSDNNEKKLTSHISDSDDSKDEFAASEVITKPQTRKEETKDKYKLNLQNLYALSGSNPKMASNIINLFLKQLQDPYSELLSFVKDKSWDQLKASCHKIKSSYSIIGATELKKNMETIEVDCINKTIDAKKFKDILEESKEMHKMVYDQLEHEVQVNIS